MKTAGVLAVAAALTSGVSAKVHGVHNAFHLGRAVAARNATVNDTCGCTTIYTTITGEGTLYFPPAPATTMSSMSAPPAPPATTSSASTTSTTSTTSISSTTPAPSTSTVVVVPTPFATTCPTPGVYTIPATTLTLTESTTVCAGSSTSLPSGGTYTAGGVVTVVETATTVVCPYATTTSTNGAVTSTILTTTYVCPSSGTYTIAPLTTTCSESTVWVVPTPTSYPPGTYTQPEVVTTVTETDYVVVCPFTSPAPAAPASTSAAPVAPAPVASSPVAPAPVASSPAAVAPSAAAPSPPTTGSSSVSIGSSGGKWAITYSPYNNDESCKSASSVEHDISVIASKGFTSVRVYSTDCSGLANIGAACSKHGLKMILGVFINQSGASGAAQQVTDIKSWAQWSLVELVVIGNEAIFNTFTSASQLASFISSARSTLSSAGYHGAITTTEPLNVWQESGVAEALCAVVDVVGCNIHPFFNPSVDASSAGAFVASQLQIVDNLCPGKSGVNLETGWPSSGNCNGAACPGESEQSAAVASIQAHAGEKSVMFSYTNDMWKTPGDFECEQFWGAIQLFG